MNPALEPWTPLPPPPVPAAAHGYSLKLPQQS